MSASVCPSYAPSCGGLTSSRIRTVLLSGEGVLLVNSNNLRIIYLSEVKEQFAFIFRLIGTFRMVLQQLVEVVHVKISDYMIDVNNVVIKVSTT